ncbi:MAG: hypothetical protein ACRD16_13905 [Thermoanaerobaculia bacterium]
MRRPKQVLSDWIISVVTKPRRNYRRFGFNDAEKLKKHVRKCDVILVDGDQRVSQAIKTLTMSSWSHNCVYIGDELLRRGHPLKDEIERRFGKEAQHLVIEALVSTGVVVSPLVKYLDFNLRVCRPFGLREDDARTVLDELIGQVGHRYDVKNFTDLMRYLLPFHWIPAGLREDALHLGSGVATETICSSMTAAAFQKVGFPILAEFRSHKPRTAAEKVKAALFGRRARRAYTGLFQARHPTLIVPRDFDLSPYFDIVKFNAIADGSFDYRRIQWAKMNVFPEARGRRH